MLSLISLRQGWAALPVKPREAPEANSRIVPPKQMAVKQEWEPWGGSNPGGTGGAGGNGGTGGTGGYGGTGGVPVDAEPEAGIVCGTEICTDWLCEKANIGVSMTVKACCQKTNECGAVNEEGGSLCVPVEVVETLLKMTCSPIE